MMEDKLLKILKYFRNIQPDKNFAARSKQQLLSMKKPSHHLATVKIGFFDSLKFSGALALASLLIFVLFGGLTFFSIQNISPTILTSFNDEKLLAESEAANIEIKLKEVRYYERSAQEVAALLDEVLKQDENKL